MSLEAATPIILGGVVAMLMPGHGPAVTVVQGDTTVQGGANTIQPAPGSRTTIQAIALALLVGTVVAACSPAQLQRPVPVSVTSNAATALASYQAALGVAEVALRGNPALLDRVRALEAQAAPYVAVAQTGVAEAATAPSLAALAAQMLIEAAPYILALSNAAHP